MRNVTRILATVVLCCFTGPVLGQETIIRGFTDVTFNASDDKRYNSAFALGQFDIYIVSDVTDRISFLSETVFEYDEQFIVDVERIVLRYNINDYANLEVGKHHTPIGYWNTAYHHGSVLQPTITRPLMFLFEDEGGILPIHTVGMAAWGNLGGRLGYEVMIGNGIGSDPVSDNDNAKSFSLAFHKEITDGLRLGVASYFDHIAEGVPSLQGDEDAPVLLAESMRQRMVGGNVVYQNRSFEFIAELLRVINKTASVTANTTAYYLYAGYRWGNVTPYVRYDEMSFEEEEPYYAPEDVRQILVGLQYRFSFLAVARLEYQRLRREDGTENRLAIQFAIGF